MLREVSDRGDNCRGMPGHLNNSTNGKQIEISSQSPVDDDVADDVFAGKVHDHEPDAEADGINSLLIMHLLSWLSPTCSVLVRIPGRCAL